MSAFLSHIYSSMTSLPLSLPPLPFTLRPVTPRTLEIKSKYLTPFLFFITPWGLFVSFLSECQASAWVSKQTSSSRNDVSENCHWLGMSCQSLCRANDYCWVLWELKVSNSGHCFFFPCCCYGLTNACAAGCSLSRFLFLLSVGRSEPQQRRGLWGSWTCPALSQSSTRLIMKKKACWTHWTSLSVMNKCCANNKLCCNIESCVLGITFFINFDW